MQNVFTKIFNYSISDKEHTFLAFNSFIDCFYGVAITELIGSECGNGVFFKFPLHHLHELNQQSWDDLITQAIVFSKDRRWLDKLVNQPQAEGRQQFVDTY